MSDAEGPTDGPPHEPVGSVGEEAAKLLGALSEWAREQGTDYAGSAAGAASTFAHAVRDVNEHIATGSGRRCRLRIDDEKRTHIWQRRRR